MKIFFILLFDRQDRETEWARTLEEDPDRTESSSRLPAGASFAARPGRVPPIEVAQESSIPRPRAGGMVSLMDRDLGESEVRRTRRDPQDRRCIPASGPLHVACCRLRGVRWTFSLHSCPCPANGAGVCGDLIKLDQRFSGKQGKNSLVSRIFITPPRDLDHTGILIRVMAYSPARRPEDATARESPATGGRHRRTIGSADRPASSVCPHRGHPSDIRPRDRSPMLPDGPESGQSGRVFG
jgi:hypothetical protein